MSSKRQTRIERTAKKHQKIRDLFAERYTNQPRLNKTGPKIYTSAYVIAKLSEEFYLSIRQIENIIYQKPKEVAMPAPAAPGAAGAAGQLSAAA